MLYNVYVWREGQLGSKGFVWYSDTRKKTVRLSLKPAILSKSRTFRTQFQHQCSFNFYIPWTGLYSQCTERMFLNEA